MMNMLSHTYLYARAAIEPPLYQSNLKKKDHPRLAAKKSTYFQTPYLWSNINKLLSKFVQGQYLIPTMKVLYIEGTWLS